MRPSVVRFQLTPTPSYFEELARRLYRRHENKLVRQERWGLPEGGLTSTFNRAEMRAAERTQNRSLFWLEAVVAADTAEACKTVAAAVQSRRGENRLHRRWMVLRQGLYRRRFPRALGPLIPSFRTLVSAAEVAHLLELPSARMKGVPVRRVTIPRIPAPPEVVRGTSPRRSGSTCAGPADPRDRQSQAPAPSTPPRRPRGRRELRRSGTHADRGPGPEDLYPMLRAENAEVLIHPADRKYGALLIGGQGCGQDVRAARLLPQRHRGRGRGADRDRPQVRALARLPAHDPARLRQARLVPRPRPPGVRDEPAAADRRPAARRSRRRRSPRTSSPRCSTSTRTRSTNPPAATSTTP